MAPVAGPPFAARLRAWRQRRRLSQLDLSLEAGCSQRHLSCLESGKALPSQAMVLRLGRALEVPLRERNAWLLAAGFAPVYGERPLDDPEMAQVQSAVCLLLESQAPCPAVAVDRAWNVVVANAPWERLAALLGEDLWARVGGTQRNLLRLTFHPEGLRPLVANWAEVAPGLWQRACQEAAQGREELQALIAELLPHQDRALLGRPPEAPLLPVLPLVLALGDLRLAFFGLVSTFGTAQDITTDELRIETLCPADAVTRTFLGLGD